MNQIHHLKTWPEFFEAVASGARTFEVRRDDRNFAVGDLLILDEYDPVQQSHTGRKVSRIVRYKLDGGQFGIEPGFCVLGIWGSTSAKLDALNAELAEARQVILEFRAAHGLNGWDHAALFNALCRANGGQVEHETPALLAGGGM